MLHLTVPAVSDALTARDWKQSFLRRGAWAHPAGAGDAGHSLVREEFQGSAPPPRNLDEAPWVRIPPRPLAWAGV